MSKKNNKRRGQLTKRKTDVQKQRTTSEKSQGSSQQLLAHREEFSGPIPPPQILERYDALLPGAADRILTMAESQAEHRRSLEACALEADIADVPLHRAQLRRGQIFALVVALALLAVTGLIAVFHRTSAGAYAAAGLGGGTLVSLVSVFIIGRREAMREEKTEAQQP